MDFDYLLFEDFLNINVENYKTESRPMDTEVIVPVRHFIHSGRKIQIVL